jgi:hypothetical protein
MKRIPGFPNYTIDIHGVVMGTAEKKQTHGKNGYKYVTLYANNVGKKLYIHRLVAELYIPNPENKRTVNHIDGNKHNNALSNLEWNTDGENIKHAYDNGLNPGSSKLIHGDAETMYTRFMNGESMQLISESYSFNNVTVSNHIRQYVKKHNLSDVYNAEKLRQDQLRKRK